MQGHATASRRIRLVTPIRAKPVKVFSDAVDGILAEGAIYARVSSDQQAERHTINSQVEALLARATADGHEIQAELRFPDDGQSGVSLIRPALERLHDLAAMAAIDVVHVHAPDRLARSYAHQAVLVEEFARAGAEIVFLNRPIGQTPEDTLLLQLQGMFAEYERAHHRAQPPRQAPSGQGRRGQRAGPSALRLPLRQPCNWGWCGTLRGGRERGRGGPPHLSVDRSGACQPGCGLPAVVRGRRAQPNRPCPLAAQHDLGAAHQPRLCRPSPLREVCHGTLAATAATAARSWPDPQAPMSPFPGPTGAVNRHPGPSADRRCAV